MRNNNLEKAKQNMYKMLYRFIKENGIMGEYVNNLIKKHGKRENTKKQLQAVVDLYIITCGFDCLKVCKNLFNWAPSGFYWDCSIEGEPFWKRYHEKWVNFYNIHKEEYCFQ